MKYLIFTILIALFASEDPLKINKVNRAKSEAKKAYIAADYKTAIAKCKFLIDSLGVNDDEIRLNLANAYYHENDTTNANPLYQSLTGSEKNMIRSKAYQQLGVMNTRKGKAEEALKQFKQAVKADPENEDARYNYEMLKKKLDKQNQNQKQDQKDKKDKKDDQQKKDQEPSAFAKRLKEQADQLVTIRQYREAYDLMMDGMKKDQTVSHYQDYIDRLGNVAGINKKK
jgi:Ca-activated chloride channel family protein